MKTIEIESCGECPFCNNDNEYGLDGCNLNIDIFPLRWEEMPIDKVHENCPLKTESVTLKLKEE